MRLLLISATGSPPFGHCKQEMATFLRSSKADVDFVSAANLFDEEHYFELINERIGRGSQAVVRKLVHVRWDSNGFKVLDRLDAVIVGGGNTYALLKRLSESGLLHALRERVLQGLPYIGSSAGANLTGPNILTTNDWNVVGLTHFDALGLVPFNVNPHYVGQSASDAPHSETRDLRIREYHQVWNNPVVGIEESAVLNIADDRASVTGRGRVKVFMQGDRQRWFASGEDLEFEDSMPLTGRRPLFPVPPGEG